MPKLSPMLLAVWLALVLPAPAALGDEPWLSSASVSSASPSVLNPTNGLGFWIWTTDTYPRQACRFWRSFEIPSSAQVARAVLRMTADNGYTLYVDGREVGQATNWRLVMEYDITLLLTPGTHVLAVDAFNDADSTGPNLAGVIMGLRILLTDGSTLEIGSDQNWKIVPPDERAWIARPLAPARWPAATVLCPWGGRRQWRVPLKVRCVPPVSPLLVHFWQKGWFQLTLLAVCGVVGVLCLRLREQMSLQAKAQQLLQLERARIARDIHDELGAGLTKLVLLGEVAQSERGGAEDTRLRIAQLCERARSLSHTMDEVVWAVNSKRDTLRDFASYVCKYAQSFLESSPMRCRLDVEPELPAAVFDLPLRRNLFLAVKEALNNAAKHSQGSELFLRIHRQGQGLRVVVEDNGQGIDLAKASPERNGLTNMMQRMQEVGGTCRLSCEPGAGCRVAFDLPALQARRRPGWFGWLSQALRGRGTTLATDLMLEPARERPKTEAV